MKLYRITATVRVVNSSSGRTIARSTVSIYSTGFKASEATAIVEKIRWQDTGDSNVKEVESVQGVEELGVSVMNSMSIFVGPGI